MMTHRWRHGRESRRRTAGASGGRRTRATHAEESRQLAHPGHQHRLAVVQIGRLCLSASSTTAATHNVDGLMRIAQDAVAIVGDRWARGQSVRGHRHRARMAISDRLAVERRQARRVRHIELRAQDRRHDRLGAEYPQTDRTRLDEVASQAWRTAGDERLICLDDRGRRRVQRQERNADILHSLGLHRIAYARAVTIAARPS